jgi:hypothetical protein
MDRAKQILVSFVTEQAFTKQAQVMARSLLIKTIIYVDNCNCHQAFTKQLVLKQNY